MKSFYFSPALLSALLLTAGLNGFPQAAMSQTAASASSPSKATPADVQLLKKLYDQGWQTLTKLDFTGAEKIFFEGRDKALALHDKHLALPFFDSLGTLYYNQGQWDKAGDQYTHALNVAKTETDMKVTAGLYNNLGNVFLVKKD